MTNGFWNPCWHSPTSPADENGEAICSACGAVVVTTLTKNLMMRQFETIRRNHGHYGSHSMRCVDSDAGWVCAEDCSIPRRAEF